MLRSISLVAEPSKAASCSWTLYLWCTCIIWALGAPDFCLIVRRFSSIWLLLCYDLHGFMTFRFFLLHWVGRMVAYMALSFFFLGRRLAGLSTRIFTKNESDDLGVALHIYVGSYQNTIGIPSSHLPKDFPQGSTTGK